MQLLFCGFLLMRTTAQLTAIPYYPHSATWFITLRHLPQAIWLDSGRPQSDYGRFDILSAAPAISFETHGDITFITHANGVKTMSHSNPFQTILPYLLPTNSLRETPFVGGALGYFAYDVGRRLEGLPQLTPQDIALPDMSIGLYPWAIVQDHQEKKAWLVTNKALAPAYNFFEIEQIIRFHELNVARNEENKPFKISSFESNLNVDGYQASFAKIQHYLAAGDCYQVNLAQRFSARYSGDPFQAYLKLRDALPSPFSAFMQLEQGALLSLSPERFIKINDGLVETKPIKGTIARGKTPQEDAANAETLAASTKDRAENLMIVDLLRNDLSKTCVQVQVPTLFQLQSFANVHHLVSTVTGELKPNTHPLEVLASCFPGGSITGAPKIRAMEIIEELETSRRSAYCGSMGYISCCGAMDTNIAIRTLVCDDTKIYCWGGGGIVADSNVELEYQESIAKVNILMETLALHFST
jgi:para-aminobenzoate synthetase component I